MCGLRSVPRDWPNGHRWTRASQRDKATCGACLEAAEHGVEGADFALKGGVTTPKPRILFQRAMDAIKALYHDTSGDPAVTKAELEELREELDDLIATLNV